ncbi:hypothetical protein AYI68_g6133 [Smittium mucronatum]|uniref:Uncharacterized protein n=1 Tax=Smittium mucronatum TaxID=133383 RepID=A0A1R0GSH0_9FUNG|nr:hypothetical protein AYI68_g6133 [Smittium mucronatum]
MSQDGNIVKNTKTSLRWAQEILLRFTQMEAQPQAIDIVIDDNHIDNYVFYRDPAKDIRIYPKISSPIPSISKGFFKNEGMFYEPPIFNEIGLSTEAKKDEASFMTFNTKFLALQGQSTTLCTYNPEAPAIDNAQNIGSTHGRPFNQRGRGQRHQKIFAKNNQVQLRVPVVPVQGTFFWALPKSISVHGFTTPSFKIVKTTGDHYKLLLRRFVNLGFHEGEVVKEHQTDSKAVEEASIPDSTEEVGIGTHKNFYTPFYENKIALREFRDSKKQVQVPQKRIEALNSQGSLSSGKTYDQKAYRAKKLDSDEHREL